MVNSLILTCRTVVGTLSILGAMTSLAHAGDLGFRYQNGRCINQLGQQGHNPDFMGECGAITDADYSGKDFSGAALRAITFKNTKFHNTRFSGAGLQGADIVGCDFTNAQLDAVDLSAAAIFGGNFTESSLTDAIFAGAILSGVRISQSDMSRSNLADAFSQGLVVTASNLEGSDWSNATLNKAVFTESNASHARFVNARIQEGVFNGGNLTETDFTGATIDSANFGKATLTQTTFQGARLANSTFANAQAAGLIFSDATIESTSFAGASLSDAIFKNAVGIQVSFVDASLLNADFSDMKLSYGNFSKTHASGILAKRLQITKSNFEAAVLKSANLESSLVIDSSLDGADLSGANLQGSTFRNTSFKRALVVGAKLVGIQADRIDVSGADFSNANVNRADLSTVLNFEQATWTRAGFTKRTLFPFSQDHAKTLGLVLSRTANILIIWDAKTDYLTSIAEIFAQDEAEVKFSVEAETEYRGTELDGIDTVIHLNANYYYVPMPIAGQEALVKFVKDGGIYMTFGLSAYENYYYADRVSTMRDILLFDFKIFGGSSTATFKKVEAQNHPALTDLPDSFATECAYGEQDTLHVFPENPATVIMTLNSFGSNYDTLAVRKVGKGIAINSSTALNYLYGGTPECLKSDSFRAMLHQVVQYYFENRES